MDVTAQDDRALVEALRRGDRVGLEGIYRRYADRLYTYARMMLREPEAAADAVHDAFLLAGQRIDQLRDPDRLRSWLYAIVRTECLRQLRERSRSAPLTEAAEPVADTADPAAAVNADQVRDLVHLAVAALNPGDREVVHLAIRHDLSSVDIGAALGVPANHAHARLSRARSQLERALGALLVARGGARDCPALADLLDDWRGRLTPTLRKRVARHIDDCARCGLLRREQCNPAALLTAYTAPGFLVVADTVWPRLADTDPTAPQAAATDPAAAGPDATAPGEGTAPADAGGVSHGRAEVSSSDTSASADPPPAADAVVAGNAPDAAGPGRVVHAVSAAGPAAAATSGDAAGTASRPVRTTATSAATSARDRKRRRRLAGLLLLLLLVAAGTWALSPGRPAGEQAAVTTGDLSGGVASAAGPTTGGSPERTASTSDPAGAGVPATTVTPPPTAVPPTGAAPPVPAPTGSPAVPRPPAALPLAAPFTVAADAHVRCGADTWSLVVRATGSATLGAAQVRWTPAGGRSASRAMTVDGPSARVTVGQLRASAVTWTVRVTATDGRTADSPSSTTVDPCVRPG
ncbi:RNA polymerase sigma factor, sigma-70 family [Micromonospora matsumotoense]|uniref:RNA polymerase sigma factor, sigma-70 family n=1 Tax=Micromonospora matsumotoense TaxID=121616 RepID=A0A1C5ANQ3_9ACTN|nr:sigma-70 family RNA polymerase sigma factor [Micromonospora matsumotoense]SCF46865.1 RNA polymerase sigma factor, sigma-70 family [Micromonospora matsumotoense]